MIYLAKVFLFLIYYNYHSVHTPSISLTFTDGAQNCEGPAALRRAIADGHPTISGQTLGHCPTEVYGPEYSKGAHFDGMYKQTQNQEVQDICT